MKKKKTATTKSLYGDGSYRQEMPVVRTVGELKALLATIPDDLPLHDVGYKPRWFNVGRREFGRSGEHLSFDDFDLEDW